MQVVVKMTSQDATELVWPVPILGGNNPVVVLQSTVVDVDDFPGFLEQVAVFPDAAE